MENKLLWLASSYQPRPAAEKECGKVSQLRVVIIVSILSETQMTTLCYYKYVLCDGGLHNPLITALGTVVVVCVCVCDALHLL